MPSLFSFLHFAAAFALVSALVLEQVLLRDALNLWSAHTLVLADRIYGAAATILLFAGFARVLYFEKGAHYYFHSAPFLAKLALFVIVALLSIPATLEFLSWRKALAQGAGARGERAPLAQDPGAGARAAGRRGVDHRRRHAHGARRRLLRLARRRVSSVIARRAPVTATQRGADEDRLPCNGAKGRE